MDEVELEPDGRLKSRRPVDAILDALLPKDAKNEKDPFAQELFRGWLSGFIQIAKYALSDAADPQTLYSMTRDENRLRELLDLVQQRWPADVYTRLRDLVADLFEKIRLGLLAPAAGAGERTRAIRTRAATESNERARFGRKTGFGVSDLDERSDNAGARMSSRTRF